VKKIRTNIQKRLYLLLLMNFVDGIATYVGVNYFGTTEMNKLMKNIVTDLEKLIIFKLLIPSLLLIFVITAFRINNSIKHSKLSNIVVNVCFYIYTVTLFAHILWLFIVFIKF